MNPRLAALVGGIWLIAGVGELVVGITAGRVWYVVIGSGFLVCSLLWSLNAVVSHRRRRAADRAGAEPKGRHR